MTQWNCNSLTSSAITWAAAPFAIFSLIMDQWTVQASLSERRSSQVEEPCPLLNYSFWQCHKSYELRHPGNAVRSCPFGQKAEQQVVEQETRTEPSIRDGRNVCPCQAFQFLRLKKGFMDVPMDQKFQWRSDGKDPHPEILRNISATCSAETSIFFSYFGLDTTHQM